MAESQPIRAGRRFPGRRRWAVLAAGAMLAALAGPLANTADAQPTSVVVPRHDAQKLALNLVGATDEVVAVTRQDTLGAGIEDVFSGPEGTELADRGAQAPTGAARFGLRLGVVGHTLAWFEEISQTSTTPAHYILHRTNLFNGSSVAIDVPTEPMAFTGDGWLSYSKGSSGDLLRNLFDGPTTTLIKNVTNPSRLVTDANGAMLITYLPVAGQIGRFRLDLITFATGTVERLLDTTDEISAADLSAQTVAWVTRPQGDITPTVIHQRPRTGGTSTAYSDDNRNLHDAGIQAGNGKAAYIVPDSTGYLLRVVTGSTAHDVPLPPGEVGLAAVGNRFITATGGPLDTAGVYAIDGDTVTRVATVPTAPIPVYSIALSANRLYTADEGAIDKPGLAVWSRTVSGTTTPAVSSETLLPQRAFLLEDAPSQSISFSAGRGSIGDPDQAASRYEFLDRGKITGTAHLTPYEPEEERTENHPNTSGPYTLVEGKVYAPDGKLLYTRPGQASIQTNKDDIYGSTLIWSNSNFSTTTISVRDVAKPKSATNPRKLATYTCKTSCPGEVSIWGNRVAWQSDANHIKIQTIGSKTIRTVATNRPLIQLELGENVLAWQISGSNSTRLLDLTTTKSAPQIMAGNASRIAVDGHYLARTVAGGQVVVYRLPFTGKNRPRMIGTFAPAGFTPNGDSKADTWAPQFDVSKPLTGVTLKIKAIKSGKTLRTLTGTAPDGSIRDVVWDGKTGGGTKLPVGSYRWELAGQSADGEGALISVAGAATVTGTVKITAVG
jgi:hypothetical protein